MDIIRYIESYLSETEAIIRKIDKNQIENMIRIILGIREEKGRLFFLGSGGGAGNSSHAVNDFRKIVGIESYAPTDNVSELTARVNDNGWETVFCDWLKISKLNEKDGLFVFSVGGGNTEKNVSANLVSALELARERKAKIMGIVGRDGGHTAKLADACVIIPTVNPDSVTPHVEAFQSVIWHLLVSHSALKAYDMKWESVK